MIRDNDECDFCKRSATFDASSGEFASVRQPRRLCQAHWEAIWYGLENDSRDGWSADELKDPREQYLQDADDLDETGAWVVLFGQISWRVVWADSQMTACESAIGENRDRLRSSVLIARVGSIVTDDDLTVVLAWMKNGGGVQVGLKRSTLV